MEIIFKDENKVLFGSTKAIGIGKRKPNLIYGSKAKELREKANISIEDLAKEFDVRDNVIKKIESQQMALDEKMFEKYKEKFNVEKEYFFDLDLETLIVSIEGYTLKRFDTNEECKRVFNYLMEGYDRAIINNVDKIFIDFSILDKVMKEGK